MQPRRQLLPTLAILMGGGLLIAGVYRAVPPWLGMTGVAVLFAGGLWALRRSGADRRALWHATVESGGGDLPHWHHGGGHHGGHDAGSFGGGFFDGGGHGGGGHGGH